MFAATIAVSALLAALLAFAAVRKLSHNEAVVESYLRVGVPEDRLDHLAAILLVGSVGLMIGLLWAPIGVIAATGVVCYFLVAIGFHVRADDLQSLPNPTVIAVLAVAALALRIATA